MKERPTWANKTEFLMSCIQTSVGLGNIWRFPFTGTVLSLSPYNIHSMYYTYIFTAYENGGGAFLIPYVIVLFIIGKPMYYLEMFMGQFTSQSSVKIWEINPAFRGIIHSQTVISFYLNLMQFHVNFRCWSRSNNRLNLCHHLLFLVGCINGLLFLRLVCDTIAMVTVPPRMGK